MEWAIIFILIGIYFSLSSKLDKMQRLYQKKRLLPLHAFIGKTVSIELDDEDEIRGILKAYNEMWFIIEVQKEQYYYRRKHIVSITIVE